MYAETHLAYSKTSGMLGSYYSTTVYDTVEPRHNESEKSEGLFRYVEDFVMSNLR